MRSAILLLARHTWTEAVRSRVFTVFGLVGAGLVGGSIFLTQFHFGSAELRFINDLGQGAILLFGSVITVALAAQLFFREIDQRTLLPILVRPVNRFQFLLGKYLGALLPVVAFTLGMLVLLTGLLWWRSGMHGTDVFDEVIGFSAMASEAWTAGLLQLVKFFLLGAMVFAVASFASSFTYTLSMGFALFFCGHLVHLATDFYRSGGHGVGAVIGFLLSYILPDFRIFNEIPAEGGFLGAVVYGLIYTAVFLGIASFFFQRREL